LNPSTWLDSKLADTAPALLGIVVILAVVLGFLLRIMARQDAAAERSAKVIADAVGALDQAVENNTAALDRFKERDDAREDRHFDVLRALGESCRASHAMQDRDHSHHGNVLAEVHAGVRRIEARLGKD
jgi:uncharacterized membrane protein